MSIRRLRPSVQPNRKRLCERGNVSLPHGIGFVARQEQTDAPYAVALLRVSRERPSRRAAERSDEFAPSKANAHLPLPWDGVLSETE
jgi:hypothetical protein